MAELRRFQELEVYNLFREQRQRNKIDAVDGGYMDRNQYRSLDKSWEKIGTMLNRMIQRADDLCRTAARSATLSILHPRP